MIICTGTQKGKNAAYRNETQYETCIMCGKVTPILKEQPIEYRSFYIRGCGRLCYSCYHELFTEKKDVKAK